MSFSTAGSWSILPCQSLDKAILGVHKHQAFLASRGIRPLCRESFRFSLVAKHTEAMKEADRWSKCISRGICNAWNRNSSGTLTAQAAGRSHLKNRFKPSVGSVGTWGHILYRVPPGSRIKGQARPSWKLTNLLQIPRPSSLKAHHV